MTPLPLLLFSIAQCQTSKMVPPTRYTMAILLKAALLLTSKASYCSLKPIPSLPGAIQAHPICQAATESACFSLKFRPKRPISRSPCCSAYSTGSQREH